MRRWAAYNNPDGPDDDEHKDALAKKRDEAEMALLTAPAPMSFCIWQKWEVLDYLVTTECLNVGPLALGGIRADLLRLGIGRDRVESALEKHTGRRGISAAVFFLEWATKPGS